MNGQASHSRAPLASHSRAPLAAAWALSVVSQIESVIPDRQQLKVLNYPQHTCPGLGLNVGVGEKRVPIKYAFMNL